MEHKKVPLAMVVDRMMHDIDRVLRKSSAGDSNIRITIEQFGILHLINLKDQTYVQQDLANILGKDKSAILRLIDQLEQKKLVIRVVDSTDRRKNCLHVTELGKEVIEEYVEMEEKISKELIAGVPQKDIDTFFRVIAAIRKNAEEK